MFSSASGSVYRLPVRNVRAPTNSDDLAVKPGGVLGERPVTLDGVGQTIEITVPSVPQTAVAIPYFQWDNRGGGPLRVWMPCWPRGDDPPGTPASPLGLSP